MGPLDTTPVRSVLRAAARPVTAALLAAGLAAGPAVARAQACTTVAPLAAAPAVAQDAEAVAEHDVIPDTPPGRVAAAWIEAFNAGDRASMLAFAQAHRTPEQVADFDATWPQLSGAHKLLGALTPTSAEVSDDGLRVIAAVANLPVEFALRFQVEPEPPHRLLAMEMRPAGQEATALEPPASWERLEDLLQPLCDASEAPALAAAIVEGGRLVDVAAVGFRHAGGDAAAVDADDRFHLGSITKSMTASMIARVVEEGHLAWTDTLGETFDDVQMSPGYAGRTLLEVLQHRAGFPAQLTITEEEDARWSGLPGTPTEQRAAFVAELLGTTPETDGGFQYSNAGYCVAGHWAERATGRSWEELVQAHVFDALHLDRAGVGWPATADRPDQPRGHFAEPDGQRTQRLDEYQLGAFMRPAGDVHASVGDLARYAAAHLDGLLGRSSFLPPDTIALLHTPLPGAPYACGWLIDAGRHAHEGSAGTFHARIELVPAEDRALVVVTNAPAPDLCAAVAQAVAARGR